MPIYEQTYRRHEKRAPLRKTRFWPITREALRLLVAKKAFLGLWGLTWLPFVGWVLMVYVITQFPQVQGLRPLDARVFGEFLNGQIACLLLLSVFGGSGLIADDIRTGAILVYLSRPLTRRDYVLGKLGILLALNLSATLAPGLLLYGAGLALGPKLLMKWELAWVGPAIVLDALILSVVISLLTLAVSALSRTARVAGIAFFTLMVALNLVLVIVRLIYDAPAVFLLSIWSDLTNVGNALFGAARQGQEPAVLGPALVLAGACLVSLGILRSRVRAVEVVR